MSRSNTIKCRLDTFLVDKGYFKNLGEAQRAILAHEVRVDTVYPDTVAYPVTDDADIFVKNSLQYVSRGGLKLKAAIDAFNIDVSGKKCIDVGASSGGFSDVLLQESAGSVTCVDVNYGQLDWKIRQNPRTKIFERCNIKKANQQLLGAPFDIIVADLSFISLASLMPVFANLGHPLSVFIGLIKPQYEAKSNEINNGHVDDNDVRLRTISEVKCAMEQNNFKYIDLIESPIHGKKAKNIEYLICGQMI